MYWSLNSVRVILALSVLLYHLGGTIALSKYFGVHDFDSVFGVASARVPFFFVLSGFVLTLTYAKDIGRPDKAWPYLRKRFQRIYPTYWVVLLMVIVPALAFPPFHQAVPSDFWQLVKTFLLIPQHPGDGWATGAPVIITAWTLQYEVMLYLLLAAWIFSRTLGIAVSIALAINGAACTWVAACGPGASWLAHGYLVYFAMGVAAAWAVQRVRPVRGAWWLATVSIAAYVLVSGVAHARPQMPLPMDRDLCFACLACLVLFFLVSAERGAPPQRNSKSVKLLCDSSYALYLLHFPLISLLLKGAVAIGMTGGLGATLCFVLIPIACIVLSIAFHLAVEKHLRFPDWSAPKVGPLPEPPSTRGVR
jgi:peptidoglycan/LPS O-acetylase OafA/YrhL